MLVSDNNSVRLHYIDAMRGLTMILVVYCHVFLKFNEFTPPKKNNLL